MSPELDLATARRFPKNGPTDPILYYTRPLVGWLYRERINRGLRLLPREPGLDSVLEVGFGAGAVQVPLAAIAKKVSGIDLDADPSVTMEALRAFDIAPRLARGSVYEIPDPDESFDAVVSFSVFEHLSEPERALREVRRVLRPGGYFLLGMPAVNRFMEVAFRAIGFKGIEDHHITTPATVIDLSRSRFSIAKEAHLHGCVPLDVGPRIYFNYLLQTR